MTAADPHDERRRRRMSYLVQYALRRPPQQARRQEPGRREESPQPARLPRRCAHPGARRGHHAAALEARAAAAEGQAPDHRLLERDLPSVRGGARPSIARTRCTRSTPSSARSHASGLRSRPSASSTSSAAATRGTDPTHGPDRDGSRESARREPGGRGFETRPVHLHGRCSSEHHAVSDPTTVAHSQRLPKGGATR